MFKYLSLKKRLHLYLCSTVMNLPLDCPVFVVESKIVDVIQLIFSFVKVGSPIMEVPADS